MGHLSYIVETNGENGVQIAYRLLDYIPQDVVWDSSNTFPEFSELPDAEIYESPEYVRRMEEGEYTYYRRVILIPSKSTTFSLFALSEGTHVEYAYEVYSSFLTAFRQGDALLVKSNTNVSGDDRNGVISLVSNLDGDVLIIPVVQEYEPVRTMLLSYSYENMDGDGNGVIEGTSFEYTFHWLTSKASPEKETLEIEVLSTGPRNGYIIRDVSEYAYAGELDGSYLYSQSDGKYYHITTVCENGNILMADEEAIFDSQTESVYRKTKYNSDLNITRNGNALRITNYGRCFLQNDAYYVITLSNVDDLSETCTIVVRYVEDGVQTNTLWVRLENPDVYIDESNVIIETDNQSNASDYFAYYVSFASGQLVFTTTNPDVMSSRIENNELIATVNT